MLKIGIISALFMSTSMAFGQVNASTAFDQASDDPVGDELIQQICDGDRERMEANRSLLTLYEEGLRRTDSDKDKAKIQGDIDNVYKRIETIKGRLEGCFPG